MSFTPEVDRLERDVEVVLPHGGVGVVREPAVGAEHPAARRLEHLVVPAGRPGRVGVDRVAEGHEAPDDPDALGLERLHGLAEVVVVGDGADLRAPSAAGSS